MFRKRLRSSEENNRHSIDIESKYTAYSKTDGLRLRKCRMKVKIARNQAEICLAKDINRNSIKLNKTKSSMNNLKNFRRKENEEVGLSHGEGRMEINATSLSPKLNEYFPFVLSRTCEEYKQRKSRVTTGNESRRLSSL